MRLGGAGGGGDSKTQQAKSSGRNKGLTKREEHQITGSNFVATKWQHNDKPRGLNSNEYITPREAARCFRTN